MLSTHYVHCELDKGIRSLIKRLPCETNRPIVLNRYGIFWLLRILYQSV